MGGMYRTSPSARIRLRLSLAVAAAAVLSCGPPEPSGPELVLTGGRIYATPDGRAVHSALAIQGPAIIALGDDAAITALSTDGTQVMDLGGAAVLPGLHDAWVDVVRLGALADWTDLQRVASPREVQAKLRAADPDNPVVIGWGWDEHLWPDPSLPTVDDLDQVVADRPVVLLRRSGRVAWLNSAALDAVNLPLPSGRRAELPRGIVAGSDVDTVLATLVQPTQSELQEWIRRGLQLAAAAGLTSLATPPLDQTTADALAALSPADVTLRVQARVAPGVRPGRGRGLLSFDAVGIEPDGPVVLGLAALTGADADDIVQMQDRVEAACLYAGQLQLPLDVHARGDLAVRAALECEFVRTVIGADVVPPEPLPEALSIAPVPGRMGYDLYWLDELLGAERVQRAHAFRDHARAGRLRGLASDAPANDVRLMRAMHLMLTRRDAEGYPLDGWRPTQRLAVVDSLAALLTAGPIPAALAAGRSADLVVWSEDPFAGESALRRAEALLVLVDGRVVYSRPAVTPPMDRRQGR